ncbi:MAG: slipin family protein, partial [Methylobacteriaceae bacterium]|nr:slipin family protein [Methylobacteriaceae bacterium]
MAAPPPGPMGWFMYRSIFYLLLQVKDDERAFLFRHGRFERVLKPGRHAIFDPARACSIETFKVVRAEFPADRASLIAATSPQVAAEHFTVVRAGANEIAIVSLDGEPRHVVLPFTTRVFWKTVTHVSAEVIDTTGSMRIEPRIVAQLDLARMSSVLDTQVNAHEIGLLFVDGILTERLPPGRHTFWQVRHKLAVQKFDLRPQPIEVTAQEILTKDRVSLRVTLTSFVQVTNVEKAALSTPDYEQHVYKLVQFAVREAVGERTLDEVLNDRESVDAQIVRHVREQLG